MEVECGHASTWEFTLSSLDQTMDHEKNSCYAVLSHGVCESAVNIIYFDAFSKRSPTIVTGRLLWRSWISREC